MSDALEDYRAAAREWCAGNLRRRTGADSRKYDPTGLHSDRRAFASMSDAGYVGITIDPKYGGRGLSRGHERVWREESAAYEVPAPGGVASHVTMGIVLPTVLAHASEDQKVEWVPKILRGEELWVQLLSEPAAGSDLAGILTRATRDGDMWVLNGTKVWSSGAIWADYGICLARTDWDVPKHKGLTLFKVPLSDERVTVRPIREISGTAEFCEEFLDDIAVGSDMVIGDVNDGWRVTNSMLAFERGSQGGGGSDATAPSERRRFAPDLVALAEVRGVAGDPAVWQLIARAHTEDLLQSLLGRRVVESISSGLVDPSAASFIKLGLGRRDPERAAIAMEIAGRGGIAWEDDGSVGATAATNFLNGRIFSIAGGSNQVQRNIISERLLGLPREPSVDGDRPFSEVLRDAKDFGRRK